MASTSSGIANTGGGGGNAGGGGAAPKRTVTRVTPGDGHAKEDRDPNNINSHLVVDFYHVLGEPTAEVKSPECIWEFSQICFDCWQQCCYKLSSLLCGVCIAVYWAYQLVPVLFAHIWCLTPLRSCVHMIIGVWCKSMWYVCVLCAVSPCARSCGSIFHVFGDGHTRPPDTPSLFPTSTRRPRPAPQKTTVRDVTPAQSEKGQFENFEKEKIANSVRRQMML